jgi:hypothetical protein
MTATRTDIHSVRRNGFGVSVIRSLSWPRRLPVVPCFRSSSSSRNAIVAGRSSSSTRNGSSWSFTTTTRHRSARSLAPPCRGRRIVANRLAAAAGRHGGGVTSRGTGHIGSRSRQFDELAAEGMLGLLEAAGGADVARRILLPLISQPAHLTSATTTAPGIHPRGSSPCTDTRSGIGSPSSRGS